MSPSRPTPLILPPGFGFRRPSVLELRERATLFDILQVWEAPRKDPSTRYVVSADIADGIGQDRSVATVTRLGTLTEPAEEVAQYISDRLPPSRFAYILDALGHLYTSSDGLEAMVAIECNNHGLSTQDTLQLHLGYGHFYRWEYYDAANPGKRFSTKIGWQTTPRTRPILLDKFYAAVTTLDPTTGLPDLILNSPFTIDELADFQTEGALWEAEAAKGAHDDCLLSAAIGYYVAWRCQAGEQEPLEERRRRYLAERDALKAGAQTLPDWRNLPVTADEWSRLQGCRPEEEADLTTLMYDVRDPDLYFP